MANEAGVVKSVTGGSVRAINDATGEVRHLSVGDIVYQNEKIVTDSADSKVTITQTDGKDITLIGKDTITLDQDSNNNETVADISALQQAILKGTDLNALEETAAGGPQAGNASGDGVSLGAASFAEGGHISNISANYNNLSELGRDEINNVSGISGGAATINAEEFNTKLPTTEVTITGGKARESLETSHLIYPMHPGEKVRESSIDSYLEFNMDFSNAIQNARLNLNFSGAKHRIDYEHSAQYSLDGGTTWQNVVDGQIEVGNTPVQNIKVKTKVIDDYGQNAGNQNEGTLVEDLGAAIDPAIKNYGDYKQDVSLSVTSSDLDIRQNSTSGQVIDNDNNVTIEGNLIGNDSSYSGSKNLDTGYGDDTININNANLKNTFIEGNKGDDIVNINNSTVDHSWIHPSSLAIYEDGKDQINIKDSTITNSYMETGYYGDDSLSVKSSTIKKTQINISDQGMITATVDKDSTLEDVSIRTGGGGTVDLSGKNLKNVDVHVTNNDLYNNNGNHEYKSVINIHNNVDGGYFMTGHGTDHINIDENVTITDAPIQMNSGDDKLEFKNGVTYKNGKIYLGLTDSRDISGRYISDDDELHVYANATMENTKVISGDGVDEITLYKGSHTKDNTFETGSGNDTINLNESTSGNIMRMGTGEDHVNITNGITVKDTEIYGDLYDEGGNGWQDVTGSKDTINVGENATLENVKIYGDALYDQYKTDPSYFSQEERKAISGDDEINIADNVTLKDVEIYGDSDYEKGDFSHVTMTGGNDTITIGNNAKLDNVKINGEVGDDVISIGKNAHIQNTFEINGGTGFDTLKVADNSIDFSQVSNIEKLDTTNGEKTQLTLSADDIQNILRDSDKDKLKLDGDSNDEITLTGGNWIKGASNDGYTSYSDGTTTIEIKDEVQNVIC
ncbi:retention module-containing protein [Campylobacter concisus]|uniref:retention module-containing protein n=1 Tax=Campylobacter concisus TaxID=199 RepID=UPI000D2FC214|nr:retention module-containing protein [Campylobacter concisus]